MAKKTVYSGKSHAKKGTDPLAPEGRSKYWFGQKGMDGFHHRSLMKNQPSYVETTERGSIFSLGAADQSQG